MLVILPTGEHWTFATERTASTEMGILLCGRCVLCGKISAVSSIFEPCLGEREVQARTGMACLFAFEPGFDDPTMQRCGDDSQYFAARSLVDQLPVVGCRLSVADCSLFFVP